MTTRPITDQYVADLLTDQGIERRLLALELEAERGGSAHSMLVGGTLWVIALEDGGFSYELRVGSRGKALALIAAATTPACCCGEPAFDGDPPCVCCPVHGAAS